MSTVPKGAAPQLQAGIIKPPARPPPPQTAITPAQMRTVYNRGYAPRPITPSVINPSAVSNSTTIAPVSISGGIGAGGDTAPTAATINPSEQPVIDALNTAMAQTPWLTQSLALSILQQAIASGLPVSQQVAAVNSIAGLGSGATSPNWPTTMQSTIIGQKQVAEYSNVNPATGQIVKGGNYFIGYQNENVNGPPQAVPNPNQSWANLANSIFGLVRPALPPIQPLQAPPPPSGALNVSGPGFGFALSDPSAIVALNSALKGVASGQGGSFQINGSTILYNNVPIVTLSSPAVAANVADALLTNQGVTYTSGPLITSGAGTGNPTTGNQSAASASGKAGLNLLNSIATRNVSLLSQPDSNGNYIVNVGSQQYTFKSYQAAYNFFSTLNPIQITPNTATTTYTVNLGGQTFNAASQAVAQKLIQNYYQGQLQPYTNPNASPAAGNGNPKGVYGYTLTLNGTTYYFPNQAVAASFLSNYSQGIPSSGYSVPGSSLVFVSSGTAAQYAQGMALAGITQTAAQGPFGGGAYSVNINGQKYTFQSYSDAASAVNAAYAVGSKGVSIVTAPNGVAFVVNSNTGTSPEYLSYLANYYGNQITQIPAGLAGNTSNQTLYQVNINGNIYRFASQKEALSTINSLINGNSVSLIGNADGSYESAAAASLLNPNQPIIVSQGTSSTNPYGGPAVSGYMNGAPLTVSQLNAYNTAQTQAAFLASNAGNTVLASKFLSAVPQASAIWQGQNVSSLYSFLQQHPDAQIVVGSNGSVTVSQAYLAGLQAQNQAALQNIQNQIQQSINQNGGFIVPSDIQGISGVTGVSVSGPRNVNALGIANAGYTPGYTISTQYGDISIGGGILQRQAVAPAATVAAVAPAPPVTPTYGILNPLVKGGEDIIGGLMSGFNAVIRDINGNPVGRAVTGAVSTAGSEAGSIFGTLNTPVLRMAGLKPPSPSALLSDSSNFFNSFLTTGGNLTGEYVVPGLTKLGGYVTAGPAALVGLARGQNPIAVAKYGLGNQPSAQARQVMGQTLFESFLVGAGIGFAPGVAGITVGRTALGAGSMLALNTALAPAPTPQYQNLLNQNQSIQNQLSGLQTQITQAQSALQSTSPSSSKYSSATSNLNNLVTKYNSLTAQQQSVQQALQQANYQGFAYSNLPALLQGKSPLPYAAANFNSQSLLASLGMGVGFTYAFGPLSGVLGEGARGVSGAARRVATGGLVNVGLSIPITAAQGQNPFNAGGLLYNFGVGAALGGAFETARVVGPRAIQAGNDFGTSIFGYLRGTGRSIYSLGRGGVDSISSLLGSSGDTISGLVSNKNMTVNFDRTPSSNIGTNFGLSASLRRTLISDNPNPLTQGPGESTRINPVQNENPNLSGIIRPKTFSSSEGINLGLGESIRRTLLSENPKLSPTEPESQVETPASSNPFLQGYSNLLKGFKVNFEPSSRGEGIDFGFSAYLRRTMLSENPNPLTQGPGESVRINPLRNTNPDLTGLTRPKTYFSSEGINFGLSESLRRSLLSDNPNPLTQGPGESTRINPLRNTNPDLAGIVKPKTYSSSEGMNLGISNSIRTTLLEENPRTPSTRQMVSGVNPDIFKSITSIKPKTGGPSNKGGGLLLMEKPAQPASANVLSRLKSDNPNLISTLKPKPAVRSSADILSQFMVDNSGIISTIRPKTARTFATVSQASVALPSESAALAATKTKQRTGESYEILNAPEALSNAQRERAKAIFALPALQQSTQAQNAPLKSKVLPSTRPIFGQSVTTSIISSITGVQAQRQTPLAKKKQNLLLVPRPVQSPRESYFNSYLQQFVPAQSTKFQYSPFQAFSPLYSPIVQSKTQFVPIQVTPSPNPQESESTNIPITQFPTLYQWPWPSPEENKFPPPTLPLPPPTRSGGPSSVNPIKGYGYGVLRHRISYNILSDLGGVVSNYITNGQPSQAPPRPSAPTTSSPTGQGFRVTQTRRNGSGFRDPGTVFNGTLFKIGSAVRSGNGFRDPGMVTGTSAFRTTGSIKMGATFKDPNLAKAKTGFKIVKKVVSNVRAANQKTKTPASAFKSKATVKSNASFQTKATLGTIASNDPTVKLLFGVRRT